MTGPCQRVKYKSWKVAMTQIIVEALETISKILNMRLGEQEIRGRIDSVQNTAVVRSAYCDITSEISTEFFFDFLCLQL